VNDAAPTRSHTPRGEGAKVVVVALDCRTMQRPGETMDCPLISTRRPRGR
jgi:hypothetical protein